MEVFKNLTEEERLYLKLKSLYECFGYRRYKMRKLEEYSLYAENINFLLNKEIITFTDRNGKLLALKPDVTLSVIKNSRAEEGIARKLYYKESVYRLDKSNNQYKEISQIGLEYIGQTDEYSQLEVLTLAAQSLEACGDYCIDLSHIGVIEGIMNSLGRSSCPEPVAECIRSKNLHDILSACDKCGIEQGAAQNLLKLLAANGTNAQKIELLKALFPIPECQKAAKELGALLNALEQSGRAGAFSVDFSLINDPAYYNGIIFQGYVDKFPRAVLSGGRYDNLIKKYNAGFGGMGFALYPDELNFYCGKPREYDADALLLYGANTPPCDVLKRAQSLIAEGLTVRVAAEQPQGMKFGRIVKI